MKYLNRTASLLGLLIFFISTSYASDLEREKRMADEIVDAIIDGDAVYLEANNNEFLSIYTEADSDVKGVAIILHGRGFHPDWQDAINPLRVGLAESGSGSRLKSLFPEACADGNNDVIKFGLFGGELMTPLDSANGSLSTSQRLPWT